MSRLRRHLQIRAVVNVSLLNASMCLFNLVTRNLIVAAVVDGAFEVCTRFIGVILI